MILRPFVPRAEQLESKLLMAVVHDIPATEVDPSVETQQVSGELQQHSDIDRADVMFGIEHMGGERTLVVRFENADPPRMLHIVGGDAALIQFDGSARLRLPGNARLVDLTIAGEDGEQLPLARLELSEDDQIVKQTWPDSDEYQEIANLVLLLNHNSGSHSAGVDGVLASGSNDWTHGLESPWDHGNAMSESNVDQTMTHEFGMSMPGDSGAHAAAEVDDSIGDHTGQTPSAQGVVDSSEVAAATSHNESTIESPVAPTANPPVMAGAEEENFESVVASWTSGQESDPTSGAPVPPVVPSDGTENLFRVSTVSLEVPSAEIDPRPAIVLASYLSNIQSSARTVEEPEISYWPAAVAIVICAASAAGAVAFDRRAEELA